MKSMLLLQKEIKDLRAANKKQVQKGHYPGNKNSAIRACLVMKPMSKVLVYQTVQKVVVCPPQHPPRRLRRLVMAPIDGNSNAVYAESLVIGLINV